MAKKKSKAKKQVRRTAVRVTLGLEPRAHAAFVAAGGGEGKSAYISAVLRQRERQWQQALEQLLRAYGLPLLRGWVWALEYEWEQYDRGQSMARLQRWGSEDGSLLPEESQLPALWVLCAEWYAGNAAVEQALGE